MWILIIFHNIFDTNEKNSSKLQNAMTPCLNKKIELFENVATTYEDAIIFYHILFDPIFDTPLEWKVLIWRTLLLSYY